MRKVIWSCWFQKRDQAPELVRKCLQSWEDHNPGWEVRVLDAETVCRYVDLRSHIDLSRQTLIAASLSNIVRILLLHEYGGVWADATTLCNVPLDDWLPLAANTGFFAFARPGEDRLLSSWFLAAEPGNPLVAKSAARTLRCTAVLPNRAMACWYRSAALACCRSGCTMRTAIMRCS